MPHPRAEFVTSPSVRLGMLTPSSNSVLEPIICGMTASLPDVSLHFARFRVTEISLKPQALGQFDNDPMLAAADLLADAKVDNICWNGTSAGWLGFERDRALCAAIEQQTGIRATSSVLALDRLMHKKGLRRIALVTPYTDDVQQRILKTFTQEGYDCVAERHTAEHMNFAFAKVTPARIASLIREVAQAKPDAIAVFCTNMWGGLLADEMEAELGIPILDTVATALWGALTEAGVPPSRISGWGRLFSW